MSTKLSATGQNLADQSLSSFIGGNGTEAAIWRLCVELDRVVGELGRISAAVERIAYPDPGQVLVIE